MDIPNFKCVRLYFIFILNALLILPSELVKADTSEKKPDELYKKLALAESDTAKINVMIEISEYYKNHNHDSTFIYAKRAYNLSQTANFKKFETAYTLGVAYDINGDYIKAKKLYIEVYSGVQKTDNSMLLCCVLNAIGSNFALQDNFEMALKYFSKQLNANCIDSYDGKFNAYFNLGQVQFSLKNYDAAVKNLLIALKSSASENNKNDMLSVYYVLGNLYCDQKDYTESFYYLNKAKELNIPDDNPTLLWLMFTVAKIYRNTGKFYDAIKIESQIDSIAEQIHFLDMQYNSSENLSELYESVGRSDLALKYAKKHLVFMDSIYNIENTQKLNFLNIEFETTQKEQQIASLEKESRFRRILGIGYIIVGLLVITVLFFVIRNYRQKNKILYLEKENLNLEVEGKDREILSYIMQLYQQKETLTNVRVEMKEIVNYDNLEEVYSYVRQLDSNILTKINLCNDWAQIKLHFEKVHPDFFAGLKSDFSALTLNELKLCAYTKLRFSIKEISRLLSVNPESVKVARYRLKKKLNIPEEVNFDDFIEAR